MKLRHTQPTIGTKASQHNGDHHSDKHVVMNIPKRFRPNNIPYASDGIAYCKAKNSNEILVKKSYPCYLPQKMEFPEEVVEEINLPVALKQRIESMKDTKYDSITILFRNILPQHLYIADTDIWMYWENGHWSMDIGKIKLLKHFEALRLFCYHDRQNQNFGKIRDILATPTGINRCVKMLAMDGQIRSLSSEWDAIPHFIAFGNGVYNTEKLEFIDDLEQIKPFKLSMKAFPNYDPNALCPKWDKFLLRIFQEDQELIHYVQKAVGLSLSAEIREELLFFAHGSGANGKTTFFDTLRKIFGPFHVELDSSILESRSFQDTRLGLEYKSKLKNKRFATVNEVRADSRFDDAMIKQLSSRDMITAKSIYKSPINFEPSHKLWIRGNHKPRFNVQDNAMLRRIRLVPFDVTIPEQERIPRYDEILFSEEASGILNWIIKGWKNYLKEGMGDIPEKMRQAMEEYKEECDIIQQFMDQECKVVNNKSVSLKYFTKKYNDWRIANGHREIYSTKVKKELQGKNIRVENGTGNKMTVFGLEID